MTTMTTITEEKSDRDRDKLPKLVPDKKPKTESKSVEEEDLNWEWIKKDFYRAMSGMKRSINDVKKACTEIEHSLTTQTSTEQFKVYTIYYKRVFQNVYSNMASAVSQSEYSI